MDFSSSSLVFSDNYNDLKTLNIDQQFHALKGALHHALLEWSAVSIALAGGFISFVHYYRYRDVSVPIIGLALLCAGFTDAFHTLAATRIISANVPNADFIPFTWAFSRIFNAVLIIAGVTISLWATRHSYIEKKNNTLTLKEINKYQTKILLAVSFSFMFLAITSVILAATSDNLPQTTFSNALIKRPYDILPLALFSFSGALIFGWIKKKVTILKLALLLSLIPEIATQIHMSFGSTMLFDNHFNIAHSLKIVAYSILSIGLLTSLLESKEINSKIKTEGLTKSFHPTNHNIQDETFQKNDSALLKVGTAKYSQAFLISGFIFILTVLTSLLVASVFYIDAASLAKERSLQQLSTQGDFIEPIIREFYTRAEKDINFLSHTPPIQGIINALKNKDQKNYQLWIKRLKIIFEEKIKSDISYRYIRFVKSPIGNIGKELVHSYKINNGAFSLPNSELGALHEKDFPDYKTRLMGEVYFNHIPLTGNSTSNTIFILDIKLPIYNLTTNDKFGLLNITIDFTKNFKRLVQLNDRNIYFADENGQVIYHTDPNHKSRNNTESKLQDIFPDLKQAIENNFQYYQLGLNPDKYEKNNNNRKVPETSGHYRSMNFEFANNNIVRLFIRLDRTVMDDQLTTFKLRSLMLGFALSLISLTLAIIVSRKLTDPLKQTTRALIRYGYTGKIDDLPTKSVDETGVLARSFHNILAVKAAQDVELLQQKSALDQHAIVSITDVDGNIEYVNDKLIAISGYSREELMGNNHRILNSDYHGLHFFKKMFQIISNGKVWQDDICNKAKDGSIYWVRATIVPYKGPDGTPEKYISITTDITENKENLKKLALAKDELSYRVFKLQEANTELDQFAYIASHDLKSPLNGIRQLASWIEEDCESILPDESKEHLDLLKNRCERMGNLLTDLLSYSRIGRQQHEVETVYLAAMVDDIFELQGGKEGFTCQSQNVPIIIQRTPFELVIRNLISNSLKHHDKKSGKIVVTMEENDLMYKIRVQDDGPGIPPELHEKALEMFQTLQSRDKTEGSGMGLAFVSKTVAHHGGRMKIDSPEGRGTGIIIKWPKTSQSK